MSKCKVVVTESKSVNVFTYERLETTCAKTEPFYKSTATLYLMIKYDFL